MFGDKWTVEVIICAFMRMRKFGDFKQHIGISTNILADRLARLTACGVLRKTSADERQRGGTYGLTEAGIDAYPILITLQTWADDWVRDRYRSPVRLIHRPCGQGLRPRLACTKCGGEIERTGSRLVAS